MHELRAHSEFCSVNIQCASSTKLTCVYLLIKIPPSLSDGICCHQCSSSFVPPPHAVTFAVLFCLHWFYFLFFSFRLTHSLTLMHASLLENGCTSLPGESFTHSPAWFPHDPVDQKVYYYCPAPVGYNCCHIRSDLPEIVFLFCWLAVTLPTQDCIVMKVNTEIDL